MGKDLYIGYRATEKDVRIVEKIRRKTDETSASAVLRKAVLHYARKNGVEVPA